MISSLFCFPRFLTEADVVIPTPMPTRAAPIGKDTKENKGDASKSRATTIGNGFKWRWEDHGSLVEIYVKIGEDVTPEDVEFRF